LIDAMVFRTVVSLFMFDLFLSECCFWFAFHCDKARKSDQSDHLNLIFSGDAFCVQSFCGADRL
jgi:hypothetical protein